MLRGDVKRNSRKIFSISFRYIESVLTVWCNLRKKVIVPQQFCEEEFEKNILD